MERREFLGLASKAALVGGAVAITGCNTGGATATPAAAGNGQEAAAAVANDSSLPTVEWQMATSWPQALDTIYGGAVTVAERVAAMTGGKFKITPRTAGELAPGLQVLDVVSQGAVPIGHTASYYYVGKSNVMAFGTSLPFGLNAQQQNAWLYQGGGLDLLQPFYKDKFNVIQFPAGNTGAQMGGWWKKEISSLDDLKGRKMRIPGLGGKVMDKLGVTVQVLPGGEIFQALQTGAIDGAEWVGPYDDLKLSFNKAAKYYYFPGWWEPGPTLEIQVNLDEWNKLPQEYQEILKTAAYEANMTMLATYDAKNIAALQELIDGGTELRRYPEDVMKAAEEAAFALYDEYAAADADFKSIFEQWKKFRDGIFQWNSLNEGGFTQYAYSQFSW